MSSNVIIFILVVFCVAINNAEDLLVGTFVNNQLGYSENVKLSSIPFSTRTKNVWYNTNNSSKLIKGISAIDLDKSEARATISSGGVGSTYVNVKIKSSRGDGLNYLVQIYV